VGGVGEAPNPSVELTTTRRYIFGSGGVRRTRLRGGEEGATENSMEPESATAETAGGGAVKRTEERDQVVIRFAGDSGDGMQLAGMHFTNETALAGNDLSTLPDFPAEIRAPAGTLAGV